MGIYEYTCARSLVIPASVETMSSPVIFVRSPSRLSKSFSHEVNENVRQVIKANIENIFFIADILEIDVNTHCHGAHNRHGVGLHCRCRFWIIILNLLVGDGQPVGATDEYSCITDSNL